MTESGDYISREAAIEAVKKAREYTGKFSFEEEHAWAVGFHQGITFALSDKCPCRPHQSCVDF